MVVGMGNGCRMKMSRFADFSRAAMHGIPAVDGRGSLHPLISLSVSLSVSPSQRSGKGSQRCPGTITKVERQARSASTRRRWRRRGSELPICDSPGYDRLRLADQPVRCVYRLMLIPSYSIHAPNSQQGT